MITKTEQLTIESEKVVTLTYTLRSGGAQGEVLENVEESRPLQFIYGLEGILPGFEQGIAGLETGTNFSFGLPAADAYGPYDENAVIDVPKNAFEINGTIDESMLAIGNSITMKDVSGNKHIGKVKTVQDDFVTMDFNHPLAGKDLHFEGKVMDIRDATPEELKHGHLGHECGCGGSCGCEEEGASSCSDEGSKEGGCGCGC